MRLTVAGPPAVSEMGPESGPEHGAILAFEGANLAEAATEQAKCRFGDIDVDADVSDDSVSCRVPEMEPGTIPGRLAERQGRRPHVVIHCKGISITPAGGASDGNYDRRPRRHRPWDAPGNTKRALLVFWGAGRGRSRYHGLRCVQPPLQEGTYDLAIDSSVGLLAPALRYEVLSSVRVDCCRRAFGYTNTTVEVAGLFSDLEAPLTCLFGALSSNAISLCLMLHLVVLRLIRRQNASP